jgi:hypothetical protein
MNMRPGVSLVSATLLFLATGLPLVSQAPPAAEENDCLSENANAKNKMQFFVCLNAKREYWQDQLIKVQNECQANSVKYSGAYSRYLMLKNKANQLLDMVIAELKYNDKTPPEKFKQLMQAVNASSQELDKYVQGTSCEGASNRFLPLLIPIITAALLDKSRSMMDGWLSGNKGIKDQRAAELATQRWRPPQEFGAMAPQAPPQAPPPQAPPAPPAPEPTPVPAPGQPADQQPPPPPPPAPNPSGVH